MAQVQPLLCICTKDFVLFSSTNINLQFINQDIFTCQHPYHPAAQERLKLSRVELVSTWMGDPRFLLEEVLVRPAGGAHPVVCVGPNAPV